MEIRDKYKFLDFFTSQGYVLDFSTQAFDNFTATSIGIPLCEKYRMSKGKSLAQFSNDAPEYQVVKLFGELLQYYEAKFLHTCSNEDLMIFNECKEIISRYNDQYIVELPNIHAVDREYIRSISERAEQDITNGNYDSALTKARTLLEEVFCYVIEKSGCTPERNGKIKDLYAQVKQLHNMHADKNTDTRINMLLSGLEKILSAITEMRNESSDSHGAGQSRITILDYHARLFTNSARVMAEFILAVHEHKISMNN